MKPDSQRSKQSKEEKLRSDLEQQLNPQHPLVQLAQSINWEAFKEKLGRTAKLSGGRPPLPTRLLVGLHYLKAMNLFH